jgi:hypothetical protein
MSGMAKKRKSARRSAIVPAIVFSAGLMSGAAVVPMLAGCGDRSEKATVAGIGFDVAAQGFDMSGFTVADVGFTVAATGFDLSHED